MPDAPLHCPAGLLQRDHLFRGCNGWGMLLHLSVLLPYTCRQKSFNDEGCRNGTRCHDGGPVSALPVMHGVRAVQSMSFIAFVMGISNARRFSTCRSQVGIRPCELSSRVIVALHEDAQEVALVVDLLIQAADLDAQILLCCHQCFRCYLSGGTSLPHSNS